LKKSSAALKKTTYRDADLGVRETAPPPPSDVREGSRLSVPPLVNAKEPEEAQEAVDVYFRKMARVSLLTREGEVELAKRIENGERQIVGAILDNAEACDELAKVGDLLLRGKLKARDVARNIDD
jgi:RNA polymerase primary sigma factor